MPTSWVEWAVKEWPAVRTLMIGHLRDKTIGEMIILVKEEWGFPAGNKAIIHLIVFKNIVSPYLGRENPNIVENGPAEELIMDAIKGSESIVKQMYQILSDKETPRSKQTWQKWEMEMGAVIPMESQVELWVEVMPSLRSSYQRLILFKTFYDMYLTPHKMKKWDLTNEGGCPRCKNQEGTLVHLIWKCTKLHKYWKDIAQIVANIVKKQIQLTAQIVLIQILPINTNLTRA